MRLLAVLGLSAGVGMMSQASMIPVTSQVADSIGAPASAGPWLLTSTLIAAAVMTPLTGRLGDMFGKRRLFLLSTSAVVIGCILCAVAPIFWALIVGRALLGLGTSLIPLGSSILRDEVEPKHLSRSVALLSAAMGVGGCFGPIIGSSAVELGSWRYAYGFLAALSLMGLVLAFVMLPSNDRPSRGRADLIGAVGLAVAVTFVLVAVTRAGDWGPTSPTILACAAVGLLTFAAWIPFELRRREPVVDLRLAARPSSLLVSAVSTLAGFGTFGYVLVIPALVQSTGSATGSVLAAGLWIVPSGLALIVLTGVAARALRTVSARACFIFGMAVMTLGYGGSQAAPESVAVLVACSIVIGAGVGFAFSALPLIVMQVTPAHQTAAAMGLNALVRSLGTTAASASIGLVLAAPGNDPAAITGGAFRLALLIPLTCCAVGLVLAWALPRPSRPEVGTGRRAVLLPSPRSNPVKPGVDPGTRPHSVT